MVGRGEGGLGDCRERERGEGSSCIAAGIRASILQYAPEKLLGEVNMNSKILIKTLPFKRKIE